MINSMFMTKEWSYFMMGIDMIKTFDTTRVHEKRMVIFPDGNIYDQSV